MPKSRNEKQSELQELTEQLRSAQVVILTEYRGLPVSDINKIRGQLREKGTTFSVAKNTLTTLALRELGYATPEDLLVGPTALAFVRDDIPASLKLLNQFARDTKILTVKGAVMGPSALKADQVDQLEKLPTVQESRAKIVGLIQSPLSNLVGVLNAPLSQFVSLLEAPQRDLVSIFKQRAEQLSAPEAA